MKKIILSMAVCLMMGISWAQTNVTGIVRNESGEPIQGVSILLNGSAFGTTTSNDGYFELKSFSKVYDEIAISHVGYTDTIIKFTPDAELKIKLNAANILVEEAVIRAVRAGDNTPTTFENMTKLEIAPLNDGRDIPMILQNQTSVVTSSDAGNGIGYTGLRIRGISQEKINVTINGVALNDGESHEVYWVDIPDLAGSIEELQIQRGVGSSTNGAGAFGGSININTKDASKKAFGEITQSVGSFNSFKSTIGLGTGLINNHWFLEGKFSRIGSDGYRDRASSDLYSYFAQAGYQSEKTVIKAIAFGGYERTYQAWYGIDSATLANDRKHNPAGAIYNDDWSEITDYYNDQVDDYKQDHYQIHATHRLNSNWILNGTLHYTYGRGYYEDYIQGYGTYAGYGLPNVVIGNETLTSTDLVQQLWLDNDYYGAVASAIYKSGPLDITIGSAYNIYDNGRHFGEIVWMRNAGNTRPGHKYYENVSNKNDANVYGKMIYRFNTRWSLYLDAQVRSIRYAMAGKDREWFNDRALDFNEDFLFFNPKAGVKYNMQNGNFYASIAQAHREPTRGDFTDNGVIPKSERVTDIEVGIKQYLKNLSFEVTGYNMRFKNELVPTGAISTTGSEIRENIGKSLRTGVELNATYHISNVLFHGNATFSENRSEIVDQSNMNNTQTIKTPFSPRAVSNLGIKYMFDKKFRTGINFQYVGSQRIQNIADAHELPSYQIVNYTAQYRNTEIPKIKELMVYFNVYNLLDEMYSAKATVGSSGVAFFPQAGINFSLGTSILF